MVDIRWKQRFQNYEKSYKHLKSALKRDLSDELICTAVIKLFEMTFELAWKTMGDYLEYGGIQVQLPREIIKTAFQKEIISDGRLWLEMLEKRNITAHIYDAKIASQMVDFIKKQSVPLFDLLYKFLSKTK